MPNTDDLVQGAPSRPFERGRIPNLDVGALFGDDQSARTALLERVRVACLETGFFYIHNTCVTGTVIQRALDVLVEFFSLPDASPIKQRVLNKHSGGMKGWGPVFSEPSYQKDTVAHLESFDLGQELSSEQYRELCVAPTAGPAVPGFREAILDYYEAITTLGRGISEIFSTLLGEDRDFISRNSKDSAPRTMRLLHYPENDAPADHRNVGIAAHTDFECFTIMNQTAAGLELTNVDGEWFEAPSDIGTFTIILGDMLERFSNGHLRATGHRVVNSPWTRHSIVFFFAVDGDYAVSPLPRFVGPDNPDRYGTITQDQHISQELARAAANSS
jgi:isopenicillin N synthase-like dioxygenase